MWVDIQKYDIGCVCVYNVYSIYIYILGNPGRVV